MTTLLPLNPTPILPRAAVVTGQASGCESRPVKQFVGSVAGRCLLVCRGLIVPDGHALCVPNERGPNVIVRVVGPFTGAR